MKNLFTGVWIMVPYLVAALAIYSGLYRVYWVLIVSLSLLFTWDLLYTINSDSFVGRDFRKTNESVTRARTYISWYFGIYGIIVGLVFTSSSDRFQEFSSALSNSSTPIWLLTLPIGLSIISMLFVPLKLQSSETESVNQPNAALRSLFLFVVFSQKVILILIGHIGLRILASWP